MRFAFKMGASIMLLVAIALGLVDTLNYFKYKTLLANLVRSRMEVATADLQGGVQQALSLGLSLDDTRTAADLIALAKRQDPLIQSIAVYEAGHDGGRILYDTDATEIGKPAPTGWVDPLFAGSDTDALWQADAGTDNLVGATLVDRLVQPIGGIALRYSGAYERDHLDVLQTQLFTASAEVLALAAVLNLAGIMLVFRPISARLREMNRELQGPPGPEGTLVDPAIVAFSARVREAEAALVRAEQALDGVAGKGSTP